MVKGLAFFLFTSLALANTTVLEFKTTASQALIRIRTDQVGLTCTVLVSELNNFGVGYTPVKDVDVTLFPNSNLCTRSTNILNANEYTIVIGQQTVEVPTAGLTKVSRSLEAAQHYYYSIPIGSDTITGDFTTSNINLGNTRQLPRFDRNRPGEYLYPTIDFNPATGTGKKYIDPNSGTALTPALLPGQLYSSSKTLRSFNGIVGGSGWTGQQWIGTGVSSFLKLRANMGTDPNAATDPAFTPFQSIDSVQLNLRASGSVPGIQVCITNDFVNVAGGCTPTQAVTATPTNYTMGSTTPIMDSFRNSPVVPSSFNDVQPHIGHVIKSGTSVTWVAGGVVNPNWGQGYWFSLKWGAGSIINLGGTDGNGLWTGPGTDCSIASVTNEKALVLSSAGCIADGTYSYQGRNWGFMVRATGTGTLTIAGTPTWTSTISGSNLMAASGIAKLCSTVHVPAPNGGYLCEGAGAISTFFSANPIFWFGDDGTSRLIAGSYATSVGTQLNNANCGAVVWDYTVLGKYWCIGKTTTNDTVLYSITLNPTYTATTVPVDAVNMNAVAAIESTNLDTMVTNFTSSQPTKFSDFLAHPGISGWGIVGNQGGYIIMDRYYANQDSPAWIAVFDPTTGTIVAAHATYGGGDITVNRWCADHTSNIGGDTHWWFLTCNPIYEPNTGAPTYVSNVSSGTLTSTFAICPANQVVPTLAGQTACSTVTLADITPKWNGNSLFGQTYRLGDEAIILASGAYDGEIVRILSLVGNVAIVQRNARPLVYPFNINTNHTGALGFFVSPGAWHEYWWNFVDDPHGLSLTFPYGLTMREDPIASNCHQVYGNALYVEGCVKDESLNFGKSLRLNEPPKSFTTLSSNMNPDAPFSGSQFVEGANCLEQHPSIGQRTAIDWEKQIWADNRPYCGNQEVTAAGNVTLVSGSLYKLSAAATAAFQYKLQGIVGMAGTKPLVDVSPAIITNTVGDNFKFCYVVLSGDCAVMSIPGEIYFNIPQLTSLSAVSSRFIDYPYNTLRDVTFTQNTFTFQTLMQGKVVKRLPGDIGNDPYGIEQRRVTTQFAPPKAQSAFWNSQALPTNKFALGVSMSLEEAINMTFLTKLTPWPWDQSTNRGYFINVPFDLDGVTGDSIRIRYGYNNFGPPTALYCHERQKTCTTSTTSEPFLWIDQSTSSQWTPCSTGCRVNLSALSGNILYAVIDRKDTNGVITSETMEGYLIQ